jgi:SH3-like domain-containing protein
MRKLLISALLAMTMVCAARAADDDVLRYVSLDTDKAFMRTGPGLRYPVEWVYVRPGWPFEVVSEYGYWRKLRDIDGTSGWMHMNLLTSRRRVIVTGDVANVYAKPDTASRQVALAENGVVADLRSCDGKWCEIAIPQQKGRDPITGYAVRAALWGADDVPGK